MMQRFEFEKLTITIFRQQHKDAIQGLARRHTTATAERLLQGNSIFNSKHQSEVDLLAKEDQTAPVLLEPELAA